MTIPSKDTIFRINGKAEGDGQLQVEFCQGLKKAVDDRANYIESVANLKLILDEEVFKQVRSNLAGLRHICAVTTEVADFHSSGDLSDGFKNLNSQSSLRLKASEEHFNSLKKHFSDH